MSKCRRKDMKLSSGYLLILILTLAAWAPEVHAFDYSFGAANDDYVFPTALILGWMT